VFGAFDDGARAETRARAALWSCDWDQCGWRDKARERGQTQTRREVRSERSSAILILNG